MPKIIARYFREKGMDTKLVLPDDIWFLVSDRFGNAKGLPAPTQISESP
jgi:hypothetical protein